MNADERLEALQIDPRRRADVTRWLGLLGQWNARIDLTAARSDDELYDLMLADAVVLARHIHDGARVVDVGSGAGAPGLALALLRPDLTVTLVEPLNKRVAFLRTVIGSLGRLDIELVPDRGETVAQRRGKAWDVAISRATLAPDGWLRLAFSLAESAWVLLAREAPPATDTVDVPVHLAEDVAYAWPLTNAARRAVHYRHA